MKLELKHLAPYLPYGLRLRDSDGIYKEDRILIFENMKWLLDNGRPILRPLSDLEYLILNQKQQELKTKEDTLIYWSSRNYIDLDDICYNDIQWFLKNHFDIFGLIEQGLAIDINTLKK